MTVLMAEPEELLVVMSRDEDCRVLDIRRTEEFVAGHIAGAENLPMDQLLQTTDSAPQLPNSFYLIGNESRGTEEVARQLASARDRNVFILRGGMGEWKRAGLPLIEQRQNPLIEKEVMMLGSTLILIGCVLSIMHPVWLLLSGFVALDFIHAAMTGNCALGRVFGEPTSGVKARVKA